MIEMKTIKSTRVLLKEFCKWSGNHHHIEVTEWTNGDGVDVKMQDANGSHEFYLTWGQLEAMNACIKKLRNDEH